MRFTPFQLYVESLHFGDVVLGYLSKTDAYEQLKLLTGVDLGRDASRWREWGKKHPEFTDWKRTVTRANTSEIAGALPTEGGGLEETR